MKMFILSILVAFLYYLIKAQFKSIILDILIFSFVITSHLIFSYYFLPIELLIGLTGASILYTFFKKLKGKEIMQFFMKNFIIGIGEVNSLLILFTCAWASLLSFIYLLIIGTEVSSGKMIITILSLLWGIILTFARIYSKLLKWIDQLFPIRYMFINTIQIKSLYVFSSFLTIVVSQKITWNIKWFFVFK